MWFTLKWGKWRKSSIKNEHAVDSLKIRCRNYWMWINKITLPVFSVQAGSNCWLQYRLIFWKLVNFYSVNIVQFVPRLHKEVPGPTLHKRPTLRGTPSTVQVELWKLNFNFYDIKTNFLQVLTVFQDHCAMIKLDTRTGLILIIKVYNSSFMYIILVAFKFQL